MKICTLYLQYDLNFVLKLDQSILDWDCTSATFSFPSSHFFLKRALVKLEFLVT